MISLSAKVHEQLEEAYGLMVELKYRPMARGDGFGHVTGPLNLVKESRFYAERWWGKKTKGDFLSEDAEVRTALPWC